MEQYQLFLKENRPVVINQDQTWGLHVKMGSRQVFGSRVSLITAGQVGNTQDKISQETDKAVTTTDKLASMLDRSVLSYSTYGLLVKGSAAIKAHGMHNLNFQHQWMITGRVEIGYCVFRNKVSISKYK